MKLFFSKKLKDLFQKLKANKDFVRKYLVMIFTICFACNLSANYNITSFTLRGLLDRAVTYTLAENVELVQLWYDESGHLVTTGDDSRVIVILPKKMNCGEIKLTCGDLQKDTISAMCYYIDEKDSVWDENKCFPFKIQGEETRISIPDKNKITSIRIDFEEPDSQTLFYLNELKVIPRSRKTVVVGFIFVFFSFLFFLFVKKEKIFDIFMKLISICMQILLFFNVACIIETASGNQLFYLDKVYLCDYIILTVLIWGFLNAIFNNTKITNVLFVSFFAFYGLANAFVIQARTVPIQPQDATVVTAALGVSKGYDFQFDQPIITAIAVTICTLIGVLFTEPVKVQNKKLRIIGSVGYCIFFLLLGIFFFQKDYLKEKMSYYVNQSNVRSYYRLEGNLNAFFADLKELNIREPNGYSKKKVQEILEKSKKQTEQERTPNIIAIMNESFSDLSVVGGFETNKAYLPYYNSMQDNVIKGELFTSVYGGGTANTEFEFLTSNSMTFISSYGYSYITKEKKSIVSQLNEKGYETIAIHPFLDYSYNRDTIYDKFGFKQKYFIDDYDDWEKVRSYVSDKSDYEHIFRLYEANKDNGPVFIFNVTMQNHGEYGTGLNDIQVKGMDDVPMTEEYLSLIKLSDDALKELIDYFSNVDEDTIILIFGDHQPNIELEFYNRLLGKDYESLNTEELMKKYDVPFMIWANFNIEDELNVKTSTNYLSSILLQAAGVELNNYEAYLDDLRMDIPVITANGYIGVDGNYYTLEEESKYLNKIKEYEMIQYNDLFPDR